MKNTNNELYKKCRMSEASLRNLSTISYDLNTLCIISIELASEEEHQKKRK